MVVEGPPVVVLMDHADAKDDATLGA